MKAALWALCVLFVFRIHAQKEVDILHAINQGEMPRFDAGLRSLSTSVYVIEPIPPIAIALQGYFMKNKSLLRDGYKSAVALSGAMIMSTALKYSVNRTRPYNKYPDLIVRRAFSSTPSFPSGHTTAAFVTAASLSLTYKKWYVIAPSYLYAGTVAYARMRLGMHWPTDVLGGMVLGTGSAWLTWWIDKRIQTKRARRITAE